MSEAFDKVVGFFLAVVLLFGIPYFYFMERQESLEQMYLFSTTMEFVDTVRNTGILDRQVYERYLEKIDGVTGIHKVHMIYTDRHLELSEGEISLVPEEYYEPQLVETLLEEDRCLLLKGNFFQVQIEKKTPGLGERFLGMFDKRTDYKGHIVVYYGGCIRNDGS